MENIMDNATQVDNSTQTTSAADAGIVADSTQSGATATAPAPVSSGWKSSLRTDLKDSPLLAKFEDNPDGLNKAIESHANLEKLLGHEKVPIPKGDNDVEGWNRFAKAMGIPSKASEYGLPDPLNVPDALKGSLNKEEFADVVHSLKLTPAQAKNLWNTYTSKNVEAYNKAMQEHEKLMTENVNRLKGEWGDAYQSNIELGQMVINKFSDDQEMNDYLTATLSKDPRGIKFLAKVGDQFAENKMGEFSMKRFSLAPEQAREEWTKIVRDPNHPYNNDKATPREREAAIAYVNSLIAAANRGQG